jgi:glucosamine 6-phosphate synthetase-like amidotransferase/phosphosugar isomerase protein
MTMCGVFGFITKNGNGPDLARLRRIAIETQQRGHHAFGLAWLDAQGAIHTFKRPGPATANLGDLAACRGATAVIGHCRWATHGAPEVNRNNHPHRAGRGWFVHNGVVRNHTSLVHQFRLAPETECDSEVLGLLIARFPGALGLRAARAAELVEGPLAMLGLWRKPARLLVVRNGNPLSFAETTGGFYFGSLPGELPGRVLSITDEYAGVLTYTEDGLRHEAFSIER